MKTNLNIKVDADIRDRAKKLYAQMGLDMTTAVNLFLIASLREQKIPFEICAVSKPNEEEAYEKFFADKLRIAEEQERAGMARSFDDFAQKMDSRYDND